jgi:mRNA-degrading endonuclease RelE of RelBE toxin-antitoxin system
MELSQLPEYEKDLKRLAKKYRTLTGDIATVCKVLAIRPNAAPPFSYRIEGLGLSSCVIKVKKIASDSFKGKGKQSGFRLVYAYFEAEARIVLIELYHKNEKETEDRERILGNFK